MRKSRFTTDWIIGFPKPKALADAKRTSLLAKPPPSQAADQALLALAQTEPLMGARCLAEGPRSTPKKGLDRRLKAACEHFPA